jgi:hypothetical protein
LYDAGGSDCSGGRVATEDKVALQMTLEPHPAPNDLETVLSDKLGNALTTLVVLLAVQGLDRARGRDQDGTAISAMLVQLSDKIVDVTETITPSSTAIEH